MRKARKMQEALDILVGKQAFSKELQVKGDFFFLVASRKGIEI